MFFNLMVFLLFKFYSTEQSLSCGSIPKNDIRSLVDTHRVVKNIAIKDSSFHQARIIKIEDSYQDNGKNWYDKWLPLCSAFIVAVLAYLGVIKQSKAQTVSNFRVKWIDELRTSYSEFQVTLRNVGAKIRDGQLSLSSYNKDEDAEKLQLLQTKIKLLLNHDPKKQPEHVEFWSKLVKYIDYNHRYYKGKYIGKNRVENFLDKKRIEIEDVLLVIIKNEWSKAKKFG